MNESEPPAAPQGSLENTDAGASPAAHEPLFRVVAIGNFDGAHRGHAAIAERARSLGPSTGAKAVEVIALTFEPHPRAFFRPDLPHFRLTPAPRRAAALKAIGFDGVMMLPFDADFAALSPESFIHDVLIRDLGANGVVIGEDFHFGKARAGTPDLLAAEGRRLGFSVAVLPALRDETGAVISSTAIRAALGAGDIPRANAMLGRVYSVIGPVLHGKKLGRDLGYPTANMRLEAGNGLKHGIYAVRVRVEDTLHDGVASFGTRPHFDDGAALLETHLFDFSGDLYGREMEVFFHAYLRGEAKFETLDALIRQMDADSAEARRILAGAPRP